MSASREHREQWTDRSVSFALHRSEEARRRAGTILGVSVSVVVALVVGVGVALGDMMIWLGLAGMFVWTGVGMAAVAIYSRPIPVSAGPEGLFIGGERFPRGTVEAVAWEGERLAVTRTDGSRWTSPELRAEDRKRVVGLLSLAVADPALLEEEARLQEAARRELAALRER